MFQQTILMGNLTADPEIKKVGPKETSVANFTVAVTRYFNKANGERQTETEFIQCEAWDTGAEAIGRLFHKGDLVQVVGEIRQNRWQKDDVWHEKFRIRVSTFNLAKSKNPRPTNAQTEANTEGSAEAEAEAVAAGTGDDIAF